MDILNTKVSKYGHNFFKFLNIIKILGNTSKENKFKTSEVQKVPQTP